MAKTPGLFAQRTSTMRPVRLTLSRLPDRGPVPSHGGPAMVVEWVLSLNEVPLLKSSERIGWVYESPPMERTELIASDVLILRDGLERALETKCAALDLREEAALRDAPAADDYWRGTRHLPG